MLIQAAHAAGEGVATAASALDNYITAFGPEVTLVFVVYVYLSVTHRKEVERIDEKYNGKDGVVATMQQTFNERIESIDKHYQELREQDRQDHLTERAELKEAVRTLTEMSERERRECASSRQELARALAKIEYYQDQWPYMVGASNRE